MSLASLLPRYPRTPCWPQSPSYPRGDRATEDPESFTCREIVITEKLDGSNTTLRNGEALTRSGKRTAPWLAMARKHHAWKLTGLDEIIYGEDLYGVHSIAYAPMREEQTFRAFALLRGSILTSWDELVEITESLEIPRVPVLFRGEFSNVKELNEFIQQAHREKSVLGPDREGVIVRTSGEFPLERLAQNVCKSVRADHVQAGEHWTRNWQRCRITADGKKNEPPRR